jgi:uncharacterized protein (DUF305 family)
MDRNLWAARKPLICTIAGIVAGSAITALLLLLTSKTVSRTPASGENLALQPTNPTQTVPVPSSTAVPVPFRPGMMGQSDQHFIVMMISHHEGAVAMADLALSRATHPELKQLAQAIKTTQSQEIQEMRSWYKQWVVP